MLRRVDWIVAGLLMVWSACTFEANCGGKPNKKKTEKKITEDLRTAGVTKVECPELEKKGSVTCKASTDDGRVYNIQVIGNGSKLRWETKELAQGSKIAADIKAQFGKSGLELGGVTCPEVFDPKRTAFCHGTAGGKKLRVRVELTKSVAYNIDQGVVKAAVLEKSILADSGAPGVTLSKVSCPVRWVVLEAGAKMTCKATGAGGQAYEVEVVQKDDKGNVRWKTHPATPSSPPTSP
jgi:hypothetical protein